jgi:CDP-glycerol glycerophosphotransferase
MRVVYNSFAGRCSDHPRAIHEALLARDDLDLDHVWCLDAAHAAGFPAGTSTVPYGGPACVAALESADVIVSNVGLDGFPWRKRPGALYLQTWHGTPLKRIHLDAPWEALGLPQPPLDDVARWDVLLSPNAFSTGPFRSAFRYAGEILEAGSPRNDVLLSDRRDEIRARVRRDLGLADGTTAVLYTPTWRDDVVDEHGERDFALHLDLDDATRRLGADHVLLLRLHYMLSDRLGPVDRPGVLDVSSHPDVSDLYLAADAMVTDYSSTMFDFAVTGKPMVFFAYDIEHYRDTLRGFYFDFEATTPGPLVTTSVEVVDALADLDAVRAGSAAPYEAFRDRFCHLDDGRATARVVERLMAALADRTSPPRVDDVVGRR